MASNNPQGVDKPLNKQSKQTEMFYANQCFN